VTLSEKIVCPRCEGAKVVVAQPIVRLVDEDCGELARTETCPRCFGKGSIEVEATKHSHWNPEMKK
jgi:DnaJ-class molecular chaperone